MNAPLAALANAFVIVSNALVPNTNDSPTVAPSALPAHALSTYNGLTILTGIETSIVLIPFIETTKVALPSACGEIKPVSLTLKASSKHS